MLKKAVWVCCLMALLLAAGCSSNNKLVFSGNLEAREVTISAQVGGVVKDVPVSEGQTVKSGDVLIRLDSSTLKDQETQAQAALNVAQAQANGISSRDLQVRSEAIAQVTEAQAALQLAETQLAKSEVKAPVDGLVQTVVLYPGELAGQGAPLIKLIQPQYLTLTVYVPETQLSRVKVGQTVAFSVDAWPNRSFKGHVAKINTEAEFTPKNVQTPDQRAGVVFGVTINVSGGQSDLKPGMTADVTL